MADEKGSGSESDVQSTAQAVAALAEAIPVYQDAMQPAAQEIGKGLGGLMAWLMQGLVKMGIDARQNVAKFEEEFNAKAEQIPKDRLIVPDPMIAVPALQALAFTAQHDELREMFVKLLVAASDSNTSSSAHPSFAEVIKQLSPSEARLLKTFGNSVRLPVVRLLLVVNGGGTSPASPSLTEGYEFSQSLEQHAVNLDNLERVGIIRLDFGSSFTNLERYSKAMEVFTRIQGPVPIYNAGESIPVGEQKLTCQQGIIEVTNFGASFIKTCVA